MRINYEGEVVSVLKIIETDKGYKGLVIHSGARKKYVNFTEQDIVDRKGLPGYFYISTNGFTRSIDCWDRVINDFNYFLNTYGVNNKWFFTFSIIVYDENESMFKQLVSIESVNYIEWRLQWKQIVKPCCEFINVESTPTIIKEGTSIQLLNMIYELLNNEYDSLK